MKTSRFLRFKMSKFRGKSSKLNANEQNENKKKGSTSTHHYQTFMFSYLNKKITIPNCKQLRVIAWSTSDAGWIACGGENGMLKTLKLDHGPSNQKSTGGSTLSSNLTLDGHEKGVIIARWNEVHKKLATADEMGNITLWAQHRNAWFDELSTNRKASSVRDVSWSNDGGRILFVYEDGVLTVGTTEGERVWIAETGRPTTHSAWSPDGRALLIGTATGEVIVHDATTNGASLSKLRITCVDESTAAASSNDGAAAASNGNRLCRVLWHPGSVEHCGEIVPCIAVVYANGRFQLQNTVQDEHPIVSDIQMPAVSAEWNPQGTVLAIAGVPGGGDKYIHVHFFSCHGKFLRLLKIPGLFCGGLTWESTGLRVAIAIDACVYFANVRPHYQWGYFNQTVVYAYAKKERAERCLMFWNTRTLEKNVKYVRYLKHIASCEDLCVIVSKVQDDSLQAGRGGAVAIKQSSSSEQSKPPQQKSYTVAINDAVASPVEVKQIDFDPNAVLMGHSHVIVAGDEMLWIWQFRSPPTDHNHQLPGSSNAASNSSVDGVGLDVFDPVTLSAQRKDCFERYIHVDELISGSVLGANVVKRGLTTDYISAVCTQDDLLYVMRQSGVLLVYTLYPTFALVARQSTGLRCYTMAVNCNGTVVGCIDNTSVLHAFRLRRHHFSIVQSVAEPINDFERKDCWMVLFAEDDPDTFCTMEKARMNIFRSFEPEEPVNCSVCVSKFSGLKVRGFALDDLLAESAERPAREHVVEFETKSLRDTREMLKGTNGLKEALAYVQEHPHPRLWSLIVEAALERQDFSVAERAVVRCKDYPAIHFVKRVKNLDDPQKQRAEVAAFYQRFDEAEKIYKEMDRKDLALELRSRLGDWFKALQLVQEGGGDEALTYRAWENIGDYYAERQKWSKAAQFYTQCKKFDKLAKALYVLEDFRGLEKLVQQVGHDRDLLLSIAEKFLSVGLVELAVPALLKAGEPRMAVDACIHLHQWDSAVVLAEKNNLPEVNTYLAKYAAHLVEGGRVAQAIELYKKANQNHEAARLLSKLGQQAAAQQQPLKAKKFFVLAALEIETRRRQLLGANSVEQMRDQLLASDSASAGDKSLDNAWHGAEAYHYFMLCQQHLISRNLDAALAIAIRLMDYDDVISTIDAYSLVALTSYFARSFSICSKAFTRLEALEIDNEMLNLGGGGGGSSGSRGGDDAAAAASGAAAAASVAPEDLEFDLDIATSKFASAGARTGTGVSSALSAGADSSSQAAATSSVIASGKPRKFAELAVRIFTQNPPVDPSNNERIKCFKCQAPNKDWASHCQKCNVQFHSCMVTGKAVMPTTGWQCRSCRHRALEADVRPFKFCPLCHAPREVSQQ